MVMEQRAQGRELKAEAKSIMGSTESCPTVLDRFLRKQTPNSVKSGFAAHAVNA
jgi:hypothetical protein